LVVLVGVVHARTGELQQGLGERDPIPELREPRRELAAPVVQRPREPLHAPLVPDVGLEPARVALPLPQRLLEIRVEPLPLDRPGAGERLVDEVLVVAVVEAAALAVPASDLLAPLAGEPRERDEPRADVAASL